MLAPPPSFRRSCAAFAVALTFTWSAQALEGEWTGGGALLLAASSRVDPSPGIAVRGAYGLTSALDLQMEASGTMLRRTHDERFLFQVYPSLVYKFDVVRWVPYVAASAGGYWLDSNQAGVSAGGGVGAEYLLDRSFSLGVGYQAHWLFAEPYGKPLHRVGVSATWRSGW